MDLLRLLIMYEDDLLYEPTAVQMLRGKRVVNPLPKTVVVILTAAISASAELNVSVDRF